MTKLFKSVSLHNPDNKFIMSDEAVVLVHTQKFRLLQTFQPSRFSGESPVFDAPGAVVPEKYDGGGGGGSESWAEP